MAKSDLWSDSKLMTSIETFGYQMAEMGRQQALETTARKSGDYDTARYYANNAETYRVAAFELKKDIAAQFTLRRSSLLIVA